MVEIDIDRILVDLVAALGIPDACVSSTFSVTEQGDVRNFEDEDDECSISIHVGSRSQDTWEVQSFDIPVTVSYERRFETDATGEKFVADVSAISSMLGRYVGTSGAEALRADFETDGFRPVFFRFDGGENAVDRSDRVFVYEQSFTIRGIIH